MDEDHLIHNIAICWCRRKARRVRGLNASPDIKDYPAKQSGEY